jgi:hypothetical protein
MKFDLIASLALLVTCLWLFIFTVSPDWNWEAFVWCVLLLLWWGREAFFRKLPESRP